MDEENRTSNEAPLKRFEAGEYVVDLLTGVLLLVLFGPFLYALSYALPDSHPCSSGDPIINIFPASLKWIAGRQLSTFTPWLLLAIAALVGTVSRSVLILYNLIPGSRWVEKQISRFSLHQLRLWHQLDPGWDRDTVSARLIDESPFHRIGDRNYATYRASLLDALGTNSDQKRYWYYEMPLYLRSVHFYALIYTFFWTYLVFGGLAYCYIGMFARSCFYPRGFVASLIILALTFTLLIGLFEEVIVHGAAFIAIDDVLYEKLKKERP